MRETHRQEFREFCDSVTQELVSASIQRENRVGWVSLKPTDGVGFELHSGYSLYEGSLGIAVYLAAYADVTGDERAETAARQAVAPWMEASPPLASFSNVGVMVGVGAVCYALVRVGVHLSDPSYVDKAIEVVRAVNHSRVRDGRTDVNFGTAGLLLAITGLLQQRPKAPVRSVGRSAVESLLTSGVKPSPDQLAWTTVRDDPTAGFAHGVDGIAYALGRWAAVTSDDRARDAALAGCRFSDSWLAKSVDPTGQQEVVSWEAWCWGRPGVALARAGLNDVLGDSHPWLANQAKIYASQMGDTPKPEDCLCHGTFGDIALQCEFGATIAETYRESARELAINAVKRATTAGQLRLPNERVESVARPSLLLGIAGAGYATLRLLAPERVPSVLNLSV